MCLYTFRESGLGLLSLLSLLSLSLYSLCSLLLTLSALSCLLSLLSALSLLSLACSVFGSHKRHAFYTPPTFIQRASEREQPISGGRERERRVPGAREREQRLEGGREGERAACTWPRSRSATLVAGARNTSSPSTFFLFICFTPPSKMSCTMRLLVVS